VVVFEDKALADQAVAAVEKVVQQDTFDRVISTEQKGTTTEKETVV
jgi:hypothetical protein